MSRDLLSRDRIRQVLVLVTCLWIGLGPMFASTSFWEADLDCCCGGGSACLLFGCECGGHEPASDSESGDIRSSPCQTEGTAASFFGRYLGLALVEQDLSSIRPIGQAVLGDERLPEFPSRCPDLPPPRCADAR